MITRKVQITDLNSIIPWFQTEQECEIWAGPLVRFPLSLETLLEDIQFSQDNSYCLISGRALLAFGQMLPKKSGFLHLARIIVAPSQRGSGYGKMWCNELLQIAVRLGYQKLSLNVHRRNPIALNLYTTLGFKEVAERSSSENCYMIKT